MPNNLYETLIKYSQNWFAPVWNVTGFKQDELRAYSHNKMLIETRRGLTALCVLFAAILLIEAWIYYALLSDTTYLYTCILLATLVIHVGISCRSITEIKPLHMMGMTILVISGTAFILLAQQSGNFSPIQFASIAMLFMVIPIVPWGLREGLSITGLIYGTFTVSTWGMHSRFETMNLWTLQFVMIGAGVISLVLVARNASIRKADIERRFDLERAHNRIMLLSNKDPLTGAWNRRFFSEQFPQRLQRWREQQEPLYFACIDIDDFKPLNDTYGHTFGDAVLKTLAHVFSSTLGDNGVLVRTGGDEFVLLFREIHPEALFKSLYQQLNDRVYEEHPQAQQNISFSAGVIVIASSLDVSRDELYGQADVVLYQAKDAKDAKVSNQGPHIAISPMDIAKYSSALKAVRD